MVKHKKNRLLIILVFLLCFIFSQQAYTQQLREPTKLQKEELKRRFKKYKKARKKYYKTLKKYIKVVEEVHEHKKEGKALTEQLKETLSDAHNKLKTMEDKLEQSGQRLIDNTVEFWFKKYGPDYTPKYKVGEYFGVTGRDPENPGDPKGSSAFVGNLAFRSRGLLTHVVLHEKVHWRDLRKEGDTRDPFNNADWYEKKAYSTNVKENVKFNLLSKKDFRSAEKMLKEYDEGYILHKVKPKLKYPRFSIGSFASPGLALGPSYNFGPGAGAEFTFNLEVTVMDEEKKEEKEYLRTDLRTSAAYQTFGGDVTFFIFSVDFIRYLTPNFYLIGGIQYAIVKGPPSKEPIEELTEEPIDELGASLGVNGGIGIEYEVGKNLKFFAQGKYNYFGEYDILPSFISVELGFRYTLFSWGRR